MVAGVVIFMLECQPSSGNFIAHISLKDLIGSDLSPYAPFVLALYFIILGGLSIFFRRLRRVKNKDLFYISTKGNQIQISNKAIRDFVRKMTLETHGVKECEIKVLTNISHSQLLLHIRLDLWEGTSYPEASQTIENKIQTRVPDELGVDKIKSIHLHLNRMVPRTDTNSSAITEYVHPKT